MSFRAVFFGTPEFAVPCLDALTEVADVVGVVCQPDKPQGRGLALSAPPVKRRALELGLPVEQPVKVRDGTLRDFVTAAAVDVALVVAYGRILPADVLAAPRLGCVNVHASLLPALRGAAPITWSIVRGDSQTGVTLMQMDVGMDTGAMLATLETPIAPDETAGELSLRLSQLGARIVREQLPRYVAGHLTPVAQDESRATVAPMLAKADGRIDFSRTARSVHDHVRGMTPWPGAHTTLRGLTVKVLETAVVPLGATGHAPGTVVVADKSRVVVACGEDGVELCRVQPDGRKAVSGRDWHLGRGVARGDVLGA